MVCTTIKQGENCFFMTKSGCSYNGGICHEIVELMKWKNGNCNLATHVAKTAVNGKTKLNPLKASKRGSK